jgi:hypothetical protein
MRMAHFHGLERDGQLPRRDVRVDVEHLPGAASEQNEARRGRASATTCRYDARRCLTHTLQKLHGPCLCLRTRRCPATSARESCPPPAARPPAPPAHSGCRPPGPAWSRPLPRPERCRPAAAPRPALRRRRRGKGEARRVRAWWPRATRDRRNAYGHYLSRALACLAERAREIVVGGLENALGHRHRGGVRDAMACAGTVSWTGHGDPRCVFGAVTSSLRRPQHACAVK